MNRRQFLLTSTAFAAGWTPPSHAETAPTPALPRWRGFNLPPFFGTWNNGIPVEEDFALIKELGFDFVRLPMWYTLWTDPKNWRNVKDDVLAQIDRAVHLGGQYGLHVNLNLHRAPGYCVASEPAEPFNLFKDTEALEAFCFQWDLFARRYKDVPRERLSFNLLNEPQAAREDYVRVVRAGLKAIRDVSPDRLVFADGLFLGRLPLTDLADTGAVQSVHSYEPMNLTHYKAEWVTGMDKVETPTWPATINGRVYFDRGNLERYFAPWAAIAATGVPVHCGEFGVYRHTPHDVTLRYMADLLEVLTQHKIGYALWEFRGTFGILDSQRIDVQYESWKGHQLDRKMLDLLQTH